MTEPRFEGVKITLGGREFVVPPLNFKSLRKFLPHIQAVQTESDPEKMMDLYEEILQSALARNYPEITKEELDEVLDFSNIQEVFAAIMGASGLKFLKPGETRAGS
jgi:hypothetical protein